MFEEISTGDINAVDKILSHGQISLDSPCYYVAKLDSSLTAIQLAAFYHQPNMISFLIEKGASLNARSSETEGVFEYFGRMVTFGFWKRAGRFTALHIAANEDYNEEAIKILLAAGADYSLKDSKGKLPLTIAQLCYNLPKSPLFSSLDLYEFGAIGPESIPLIERGLQHANIDNISIVIPNIDLYDGFINNSINPQIDLLSNLVSVLKNFGLKNIRLDTQIYIQTNSLGDASYITNTFLTYIRTKLVKILNILLELSENNHLVDFNLGKIVHQHTTQIPKYRQVQKSRMNYQDNRLEYYMETEVYYETKVEENIILRISNNEMIEINENHTRANNSFRFLNEHLMGKSDSLGRLFSSEEQKMAKKILDADIIIGFCSKFLENTNKATNQSPNRPN